MIHLDELVCLHCGELTYRITTEPNTPMPDRWTCQACGAEHSWHEDDLE